MPEAASDAPVATELAGRHYRISGHYDVGREKIREFARAVRNGHPAHRYETDAGKVGYDALVAPPTFASVIGMTATKALLNSVLAHYDLSQILQTDQVFELHRPLLAGDRVRCEAEIESIRRVRGNDFVVVRATMIDQHDEVVQTGVATIVVRLDEQVDPDIVRLVEDVVMRDSDAECATATLSELSAEQAHTDHDLVESRRALTVHTVPKFDDLVVGGELPPVTFHLTRGDLVNYAGVSGDTNPIHFSDRAAELAGLPTVVAHGLLTMGMGAEVLTSWLGDPTAVESYSVRFAGFVPVYPFDSTAVDFTGKIKALDPERRTATVLLGATSAGKKLFGRAIAQVQLS
ncbi:fused (3R)-hydroxyacyl-ACP dehydratase subunits HadA/HadB [Nocardia sp. alder85J]|uniref:fused (3R)-hydroxyacyl-ACP dehydratase subunits HadA/HadB n=1 Tax=Nocardia sp. alder85J TaxID=2862949 RepID=UPI001CD6743A|nr:fused (3R)-hydroxyacyl-ACP dehydratase subunits HadA/HadB [Nocardia sp. alder85J]MCX4098916.1 fused (3R)-hydroxyacyl-ACP dehydratase subunits HadA/HadB [Nocardia sp. alder85J]